jgi:hypothetical protein
VALKSIYIPATTTDIASAPFFDCNSDLIIVTGVNMKLSGFEDNWATLSTDGRALVVYSKTYEEYASGDLSDLKMDDAGLDKIIIGDSELKHSDFSQDQNNNTLYTRTEYSSYSSGYPVINAVPSSDVADVVIEQASALNSGVATITITSADGTKTTTYKIKVVLLGDKLTGLVYSDFDGTTKFYDENGILIKGLVKYDSETNTAEAISDDDFVKYAQPWADYYCTDAETGIMVNDITLEIVGEINGSPRTLICTFKNGLFIAAVAVE